MFSWLRRGSWKMLDSVSFCMLRRRALSLVVITSVSCLVIIANAWNWEIPDRPVSAVQVSPIDCTREKYIFIPGDDGGRLAHSMVLTFRLLVFSKELEAAKASMGHSSPKHVPVLPHVKLNILQSTFDFHLPSGWMVGNDSATQNCIKASEWTRVKYSSWKKARNASGLASQQVLLDPWPVTNIGLTENEQAFRTLFKIKPDLVQEALALIGSAKIQAGLHKADNVSLVSVHLRRKEYVVFMEKNFSTFYYTAAFINNLIWNVILNSNGSTLPLVLIASDDSEWCKANIKKLPNLVFLDTGSAPLDFAVLAQSHVSVVAFGGFGFLAAFLAGGDIIRVAPSPDHLKYLVSSQEKFPNVRYVYYLNYSEERQEPELTELR